MKFYKKLYVGKTVKNERRVKWKLKHNAGQVRVFVVALAEGRDLFEIYHCAFLQQKHYRKNPPFIVGIAGGYDEAVELVRQIVEEVLQETGDIKVKQYLLKEQRGV